jgi:tetratricopeptide (TPR) repeat protein/TolB-like protein
MNKMAPTIRRGQNAATANDGRREVGQPLPDRSIVRIHLFGPMRATTCFGDDILPDGKKARAILAYLCMAAGAPVSRARLVALLWDRMPAAVALANLRQALCEMSSGFGTFAHELISFKRDHIKLSAGACWVDALAALAVDPNAINSRQDGLGALCAGELLSGLDGISATFDRWLLAERARVFGRLKLPPRRQLENECAPAEAKGTFFGEDTSNRHLTLTDILRRRSKPSPKSSRNRLRVGVLSFAESRSEANENLTFALGQELIAALARFRWFDVIAAISINSPPSSSIIGEHQIRRMDLDYLVDWTVSEVGQDTEVSVRLLDLSENARPIWGKRFDLAHGGPRGLNDLVAANIVGHIDPVIPFIEGERKSDNRYGATGLLRRAIPLMFTMEREKYQQAGQLINRALEIDPDNSDVAAWAARWRHFRICQGWAQHTLQEFATVGGFALRALKSNPDNAEALGIYAHYCAFTNKDFNAALYCFDRALRLNPSQAFVWGLSGSTYCYIGEPLTALERLDHYRELAPFDPFFSWFEVPYTIAYMFKGDYERAVTVGRRAVKAFPAFVNAYKPFIASLGHLGRCEEARPYVDRLLRLEPTFTVENFAEVYPIKKASDRKRYMEGLRLAGIRER